jgi:ABC-2 type transport system permease protein
MNITRAWRVMRKELQMGPRSPVFIYALVAPFVITFLLSAVFGSLLDPEAKLGIVDLGDSQLTVVASELDGISLTRPADADALRSLVESHDLDAGLVLPADFDDRLRAGEQPELEFYVAGESLASTRIIIGITALDLIRDVAGEDPPVDVVVTILGDEDFVPIGDRLLPMMLYFAAVLAGVFLPAASLIDEREKRTLDAVLVTPTRMSEVLVAKGAIGFLLAVVLSVITLALNQAFGTRPLELILFLVVGSVMMVEFGLILGCWAKDANTMFTAIKGAGIIVFLPAIFTIWPDLPQWIPWISPTYYFLTPTYEIAVEGAALGDLWLELVIGIALCVLLLPVVARFGRRAELELATTVV